MTRTVWFIAEHEEGTLHSGAGELAAAARGLEAEAVAVVCGADGQAVANQAALVADRVILIEDPTLAGCSADAWGQAIVQAASQQSPAAILLPHSPLGRELAPLLAVRLESGMISDCIELEWADGLVGTRSVYRRKLVARERVTGDAPAVATCQRGAFTAGAPGVVGTVQRLEVEIDAARIRTRRISLEHAEPGEQDITEADVIVAGGRGFGDKENFALVGELASALGGAAAASRPVVDQGWVPHDRQVGSSGVTVRPKLYFALGISGAIQHIVGRRESDIIVAVNKDPQAPIFEYAHYGIVDDVLKVVPALIAAVTS